MIETKAGADIVSTSRSTAFPGNSKFGVIKTIRAFFRLFLLFLATFVLFGIWFVVLQFTRRKSEHRRQIFSIWSRFFLQYSGAKISVIGNVPSRPFLLVSNHLGYLDIPVLNAVTDGFFVAKSDIRKWLLIGRIVESIGNIFVDRNKNKDAKRTANEILTRYLCGDGVIFFPEATSTDGRSVLPFRSALFDSAATAGIPVHCCALRYSAKGDNEHFLSWCDETPFHKHLFNFFRLREFEIKVTFGDKPIRSKFRKQLAEITYNEVVTLIQN